MSDCIIYSRIFLILFVQMPVFVYAHAHACMYGWITYKRHVLAGTEWKKFLTHCNKCKKTFIRDQSLPREKQYKWRPRQEQVAEGPDGSVRLKWPQTQGPTHWLHFNSSSASLPCPHQALGQFFISYLFLCICPHLFSYGPVGNETFPCIAFLSFLKIFYLFNFGCVGSTLLCGLCSRCNEQGLLSSCGAAFSLLWLPVAESRL